MSGIDIPIRKFTLVPRTVFYKIVIEKEKRDLDIRAEKEAAEKARKIKEAEDRRLADEAFVSKELLAIMDKLECTFDDYKKRLIEKNSSNESFPFSYYSQTNLVSYDQWKIVALKAKKSIEAVVPIDCWGWEYKGISCRVRVVEPIEGATQKDN